MFERKKEKLKAKKKGNTGQMWATEIRASFSALVSYNAARDVTADKHGDLKQMVTKKLAKIKRGKE